MIFLPLKYLFRKSENEIFSVLLKILKFPASPDGSLFQLKMQIS